MNHKLWRFTFLINMTIWRNTGWRGRAMEMSSRQWNSCQCYHPYQTAHTPVRLSAWCLLVWILSLTEARQRICQLLLLARLKRENEFLLFWCCQKAEPRIAFLLRILTNSLVNKTMQIFTANLIPIKQPWNYNSFNIVVWMQIKYLIIGN